MTRFFCPTARRTAGAGMRWSLELAPTGLLKAGNAAARLLPTLPSGTQIYLPSLPMDPPDAMADALALLRRENGGLVPVPHIPARRTPSAAALERRLCAWQRASGDRVREVLVVRGDATAHHGTDSDAAPGDSGPAPPAEPPFGESLRLLETGVLQRCGVDAVSLCGHPEGVGPLTAEEARGALLQKLLWAESSGVRARVVTQFCFDAAATAAYVDALRAAGAACPVSVGVVGPSTAALRARMADRCGVTRPDEALEWPAEYVRRLARWQAARDACAGAQALHVYPFGGLPATLDWLRAVIEADSNDGVGSFKLAPEPPPGRTT